MKIKDIKNEICKYCDTSRSLKFQPVSFSTRFNPRNVVSIKQRKSASPCEGARIIMKNRIIVETQMKMDILIEDMQTGYLLIDYPIYKHICLLPEEIKDVQRSIREKGKRNYKVILKTGETFEVKMSLKKVNRWREENSL